MRLRQKPRRKWGMRLRLKPHTYLHQNQRGVQPTGRRSPSCPALSSAWKCHKLAHTSSPTHAETHRDSRVTWKTSHWDAGKAPQTRDSFSPTRIEVQITRAQKNSPLAFAKLLGERSWHSPLDGSQSEGWLLRGPPMRCIRSPHSLVVGTALGQFTAFGATAWRPLIIRGRVDQRWW